MKRPVALLLVSLVSLVLAASALAQPVTLTAVLNGPSESPANTTTGSGSAVVKLDNDHTTISLIVVTSGLTGPITLAHIHGPVTTAGGTASPKVNIPVSSFSNGKATLTVPIAKADGDDIANNPQKYYVNVHTAANSGGEIRGFLTATPNVTVFAGDMRGTNEVPATSSTAVGAYFMTLDAANTLTYEINIGTLQNPTLAHIHTGASGATGSPIVTFAANSSAFSNGRLKGTIPLTSLTSDQLLALRTTPQNFYVNVHSTANGGGEIRGQLSFGNEYDVAAAGKVTSGGGNFVTDTRIFNSSFDSPVGVLVEYFPTGTSANANASQSMVVNIPPRGTAVLDDISTSLGSGQGTGALRISSSNKLAVTSRVYNDLRSSGRGTFGQFVSALTRSSLLAHGSIPQLSNSTDLSTGFRTNVGFFNPNGTDATVRLDLRDQAGTSLGTTSFTLAAMSQRQASLASFFPGVDLANRPNLTLTFDSSLPIAAFGSIIDNVSTGQVYVPAQDDTGLSASI